MLTLEEQEAARTGEAERSGNGAAVPVLPKTKSSEKRLHSVQPVREKLAERGEHHDRSAGSSHAGHNTYKAGEQSYCSNCRAYF